MSGGKTQAGFTAPGFLHCRDCTVSQVRYQFLFHFPFDLCSDVNVGDFNFQNLRGTRFISSNMARALSLIHSSFEVKPNVNYFRKSKSYNNLKNKM